MSITSLQQNYAAEAMREGLNQRLRSQLREGFEAAAKPIIDEAVEQAFASLQTAVQSYYEPQHMRGVVELILQDKRSK
ncbi:hypothetical protein [Rhizobium leguminosarum]|uniref:hypothetical protein n=1 Tax=Rhizobium leguminosarum TaxID=384 RepID=UPI001C93A626|nr:hypothetical protein [Rhizobium leguminosarum]MBY5581843.1 hypothetical protein [Rhizobium leguminosarum]